MGGRREEGRPTFAFSSSVSFPPHCSFAVGRHQQWCCVAAGSPVAPPPPELPASFPQTPCSLCQAASGAWDQYDTSVTAGFYPFSAALPPISNV